MGFNFGTAAMGGLGFGGVGGLSGLFDDGTDKANQQNLQQLQFVKNLFGLPGDKKPGSLFGALNQGYAQGLPFLHQALTGAQDSKQKANSLVGNAGTQAYRAIQDQANQASASARQRQISSGVYNTTGGQVAENQIRYQAGQSAAGLGSALGGQLASTELAGQSATNAALADLAQYYASKGAQTGALGSSLASNVSAYQFQPGQSPFQQLAPLLGYTMGSFL